jgi:hypothetical protein
MRMDLYIPESYEVDAIKFRKRNGKNTSRQICQFMRDCNEQNIC